MTALTKHDRASWEAALLEFNARAVEFRALNDDDDIDESALTCLRYSNAERALLAFAAPDIEGVIEKLMIFFEMDIVSGTEESDQKLKVIGDLRRIQTLASRIPSASTISSFTE